MLLLAAVLRPLPLAAQGLTPPEIAARSWFLLDVTSGQALAEHQADMRVDPASLTKLMTAYLTFTAIRNGRLALDARPPVSDKAYRAIGSRMFVDPRQPASIEELLNGMIVQSGNDASIILAEAAAGTEQAFVERMNREAQRMGLANTSFANSTGLPDPQHYASARDMAVLAANLIRDFPDFYQLYSKKSYTYNNIRQENRNRLLFVDPTVDGVKTGHTEAAGYCLIASSQREQAGADFKRRLVSVVMGAASASARAIESQKLLTWGFQNTDAVRVYDARQPVGRYSVWKGAADTVGGGLTEPLFVTVPRGRTDGVRAEIERLEPLVAPVSKDQRIGTLRVRIGSQVAAERPLVALESVQPAGLLKRSWDTIQLWFK
ncbi:MAG: D-alanyl-D-alanine carboxypeptidase [Burkholderiales bacterium]|nr:MAG: D-alanyl-D-alanine carboxypeptidase [Burkholderiales bacterium]